MDNTKRNGVTFLKEQSNIFDKGPMHFLDLCNNFIMTRDQNYDICFRRERGYCSLCFTPQIFNQVFYLWHISE